MATEQESARRTSVPRTIHRPADEIADRPQLKVKPLIRQEAPDTTDEAAATPASVAAAATVVAEPEAPAVPDAPELQAPAELPDAGQPSLAEPPKKVTRLPRIDPNRDPALYATHRPAPPDEAAEKAHLVAVTGQRAVERQVSSGFLIGVALIVVVLIGGVLLARMGKHVQRLDSRVSALEQSRTPASALGRLR
jgi:hypothetical protein